LEYFELYFLHQAKKTKKEKKNELIVAEKCSDDKFDPSLESCITE